MGEWKNSSVCTVEVYVLGSVYRDPRGCCPCSRFGPILVCLPPALEGPAGDGPG